MSYFNNKNCNLSLKHYEVLFKFTEDWENKFWTGRQEDTAFVLTDSAKYWFSYMLFGRLNVLFANTINYLYQKALESRNPMLGINPDFAPKSLKDEVSEELNSKLCENPEILFEGREKLREYCNNCIRQHSDVVNEMLERIAEDKDEICSEFLGGKSFSQINFISAEAGDCHFKGHRTSIIGTDCGKFLYKPHSLKNDMLLRSMTDRFFPDTLVIPKAIDHKNYGYSKFIDLRRPDGEEEAKAFFRRLGGVSAIILMLGSNDFHVENVLSSGAYPALIDLETILIPSLSGDQLGLDTENDYFKISLDTDVSLIKSGILPHMIEGEEYSPYLATGSKSILPKVDGEIKTVKDYWDEFEEGFRTGYNICLEKKDDLRDALREFSSSPMRLLLRNTNDYAKFLQRIYTVTALSSQEVTERLYSNMKLEVSNFTKEQNDGINSAERDELSDGDIPYFNVLGGSYDLCSGNRMAAEKLFSKSPVENALYHLDKMNEDEREFEVALLKNSLEFAVMKGDKKINNEFEKLKFTEEDYRAEAENILHYIQKNCVKTASGNHVWFGMVNERGTFSSLSPDFSMGTLGIALFCAEYYSLFGDESAKETAVRAAHSAESFVHFMLDSPEKVSAMYIPMDLGDVIRVFLRLGDLLHEEKYIALAKELTSHLSALPDGYPEYSDYYAGTAGLLYALCTDDRLSSCEGFRETVKRHADKLLIQQTLKKEDGLFGWDTLGKNRLISGLGHGQVGIGLALYTACLVLGDERYRKSAEDALKIEHELYSEKIGTWPDLRETSIADASMNGICSGAPGMGLAYLKFYQHGLSDEYLDKAIDAVLRTPPAVRDHLCCGNAGSVEFLIEAGRTLDNEKLLNAADERICWMLSRKKKNGSFRFLPLGYKDTKPFNMGFGISGLGHILLRRLSDKTETYLL